MDHAIALLTGPGGALVLAIFFLVGGLKKWWVFGWQYQDCVEEKKEWKQAALRATGAAESAVSVGEHLAREARPER